jgi:hypothetical protein
MKNSNRKLEEQNKEQRCSLEKMVEAIRPGLRHALPPTISADEAKRHMKLCQRLPREAAKRSRQNDPSYAAPRKDN